ncbi:MAG: VTT domain-containing protein [Candidatus Aenigmatarchaeota archaeon]
MIEISGFFLWLIKTFSYLGIFTASLVGSSTIFIPFPLDVIISFAAIGLGLHPLLVGISAGAGATFGEITGYLIGLGSREIIEEKKVNKKIGKTVKFLKELFEKHGFLILPIAAFVPFPFDIIGISAGIGNYDVKKFLLGVFVGKAIRCILIAYISYFALPQFMIWLGMM